MTEPKFKPGDLAWSPRNGFAVITEHSDEIYQLAHVNYTYDRNGFAWRGDRYPTLLTLDEAAKLGYFPEKKKVKKQVKVWVNVYKNVAIQYEDKSTCEDVASKECVATAVECTGEYEVEE